MFFFSIWIPKEWNTASIHQSNSLYTRSLQDFGSRTFSSWHRAGWLSFYLKYWILYCIDLFLEAIQETVSWHHLYDRHDNECMLQSSFSNPSLVSNFRCFYWMNWGQKRLLSLILTMLSRPSITYSLSSDLNHSSYFNFPFLIRLKIGSISFRKRMFFSVFSFIHILLLVHDIIHPLSYNQSIRCSNGLTLSAVPAGGELGASNWILRDEFGRIMYFYSSPSFYWTSFEYLSKSSGKEHFCWLSYDPSLYQSIHTLFISSIGDPNASTYHNQLLSIKQPPTDTDKTTLIASLSEMVSILCMPPLYSLLSTSEPYQTDDSYVYSMQYTIHLWPHQCPLPRTTKREIDQIHHPPLWSL